MVVQTQVVTSRLGIPQSTVERGSVEDGACSYIRRWSWACGCSGEIIGGALIELACCEIHTA